MKIMSKAEETMKETLKQFEIDISGEELIICDGLEELVSLPEFLEKFSENLVNDIIKTIFEKEKLKK